MAEVRIKEASPLTVTVKVRGRVETLVVEGADEANNKVVLEQSKNSWKVKVKGGQQEEIERGD
jgi:hypothetical protein